MRLVVRAAPWALALGSAYGAECDGGLVAHCIVGHVRSFPEDPGQRKEPKKGRPKVVPPKMELSFRGPPNDGFGFSFWLPLETQNKVPSRNEHTQMNP